MLIGEKELEKHLAKEVERVGGWSIKLLPFLVGGLPDRLCLFQGGKLAFVEVKTKGEKPTRLQTLIHRRLAKLDFIVWVVDSEEDINRLIKKYE